MITKRFTARWRNAIYPAVRLLGTVLLLVGMVGVAPARVSSDQLQMHTMAFPVVYKNYADGGNLWNTKLSLQNIGLGEAAVQVWFDGGFPHRATRCRQDRRGISRLEICQDCRMAGMPSPSIATSRSLVLPGCRFREPPKGTVCIKASLMTLRRRLPICRM